MSRQEVYQKFETETTIIIIKEDRKLYSKQNEVIPYCALLFSIKNKKTATHSKYAYSFINPTTKNEINAFIVKFLEDPNHRNEHAILIEGDKSEDTFSAIEDGINIQCKRQIEALNRKEKVEDQDLNILRTQGMDKYSNMDIETIEELVETDVMLQIKNRFLSSAKVIKVCRWYLRGLNLNLAIQKVICDEKIIKERKKEKNVIIG